MKLVFTLVIFVSVSATASGWLTSVGANANYQLATNGRSYETVVPVAARVGYRFSVLDVYGEYSYVGASSGTSMVSVAQTNQEFLIWARRRVEIFSPRLAVYGAAGAGLHVQSVAIAVGDVSDRAVGVPEALTALATGLEWHFAHSFAISAEGRVSFAESYAPSPVFGLGTFISFLF